MVIRHEKPFYIDAALATAHSHRHEHPDQRSGTGCKNVVYKAAGLECHSTEHPVHACSSCSHAHHPGTHHTAQGALESSGGGTERRTFTRRDLHAAAAPSASGSSHMLQQVQTSSVAGLWALLSPPGVPVLSQAVHLAPHTTPTPTFSPHVLQPNDQIK